MVTKINMKQLFIITAIALLLYSCMEEQGNYDYNDINEIAISGIESYYVLKQFEVPGIEPVIQQTINTDESNLKYIWYTSQGDTLCQKKNFTDTLYLLPGKYSLFYVITDKNTGVFTKAKFTAEVFGGTGPGVLVLSNLNGEASLAFFNETEVITNIEEAIPGGIGKNPVKVMYNYPGFFQNNNKYPIPPLVTVMCDDGRGGLVLSPFTFKPEFEYSKFFHFAPDVVEPQGFGYSNYGHKTPLASPSAYYGNFYYEYICNNGLIHERYAHQGSSVKTDSLEAPMKFNASFSGPNDNSGYEASPHLMVNIATFFAYDRKNRRFVQRSSVWPYTSVMPVLKKVDAISYDPFDPHNMGENMEMLHGDIGFSPSNTQNWFMVFKNETNTFFYSYAINFLQGGAHMVPMTGEKAPFNADADTRFANSLLHPGIYYSKGSKIFSYPLLSGSSIEEYDLGSNQKITCMWVEAFYKKDSNGKLVYEHTRLYVGASDPAGGEKKGSVYIFRTRDNLKLELLREIKHIGGDIVSFAWKNS
jgi:hypothetical protein